MRRSRIRGSARFGAWRLTRAVLLASLPAPCLRAVTTYQLRDGFPVLEAVSQDTQDEGFNLGNGLVSRSPIGQCPRHFGNLGYPAAIDLLLHFNFHGSALYRKSR